jgi:hypothetical protein
MLSAPAQYEIFKAVVRWAVAGYSDGGHTSVPEAETEGIDGAAAGKSDADVCEVLSLIRYPLMTAQVGGRCTQTHRDRDADSLYLSWVLLNRRAHGNKRLPCCWWIKADKGDQAAYVLIASPFLQRLHLSKLLVSAVFRFPHAAGLSLLFFTSPLFTSPYFCHT